MDLPEEFEWDEHNREKNWIKHQINTDECEQIFQNVPLVIVKDIKHSEREVRYIALGKTQKNLHLYIVFTIRHNAIRIISARQQNRKERRYYEKTKN